MVIPLERQNYKMLDKGKTRGLNAALVKNFFGNANSVGTNGPAGIHSGVQNYFTDFRLCHAVVQRPANVTSELIGPIKYWRLSSAGTKPQLL